jgi:hypothetical protein
MRGKETEKGKIKRGSWCKLAGRWPFRHYRGRELTYVIEVAWAAQSVLDACRSVYMYRCWKLTLSPSVSLFKCIGAGKYNWALVESRSEISWKVWSLMLEKVEDRLDRCCEKWHGVKEEINILHTIKGRKANWIGHILRRICLLKHVIARKIEGSIEVTDGRGKKRKQLLDELK